MTVAFLQFMTRPGSGGKHIRKLENWSDDVWERYERLTGKQRLELFRHKDESGSQ